MNPIKTILQRAQQLVTDGIDREPQDYLYLDRRALREHYQAITGTARVPTGSVSETTGASAGVDIPVINFGVDGSITRDFELSHYHFFESLEPQMREAYRVAESPADLEATLRGFAWLKGRLSWYHIGPTMQGEQQVGEAHLYHVLDAAGTSLMLLCQPDAFSPFAPFFTQNPQLYRMVFDVEVLAYNPGILGQYGAAPHPKAPRSLALVPTVIIVTDAERRTELAAWIKDLNHGELSRSYRDWMKR